MFQVECLRMWSLVQTQRNRLWLLLGVSASISRYAWVWSVRFGIPRRSTIFSMYVFNYIHCNDMFTNVRSANFNVYIFLTSLCNIVQLSMFSPLICVLRMLPTCALWWFPRVHFARNVLKYDSTCANLYTPSSEKHTCVQHSEIEIMDLLIL